MNHRTLGTINSVSEIGYGSWEIGGDWGDVSVDEAKRAVETARESGVDFFDTADVYGDGRSERILGDVLREDIDRSDPTEKSVRPEPKASSLERSESNPSAGTIQKSKPPTSIGLHWFAASRFEPPTRQSVRHCARRAHSLERSDSLQGKARSAAAIPQPAPSERRGLETLRDSPV
ncbi:MAG: aldo/keto reductase [Wenzhouxiangellaceae bacterium]